MAPPFIPTPDSSLEAPSPAQPPPSASQPPPARSWAEQTLPPAPDAAAQFKFARAGAAAPSGAGGASTSGGGSGSGGVRSGFQPRGNDYHADNVRGALSPLDEGEEEDDSLDTVILAQTKPQGASQGSPSPLPRHDPMESFRLPGFAAAAALPRRSPTGVKSSMSATIRAPESVEKAVSSTQRPSAPFSVAGTRPFQPQSSTSSHHASTSSRSAHLAAAQQPARPGAPGPLPSGSTSSGTSKKRAHTGETTGPAATSKSHSHAHAQSQSQSQTSRTQPSAPSKPTVTGRSRPGSAKTSEVGDGHDSKRRRSNEVQGCAGSSRGDVLGMMSATYAELDQKTAEIQLLNERIQRRDADLAQLAESKRKLKEDLAARVKAAIESASAAQRDLAEAKDAMRDSVPNVRETMGAANTAAELRAELDEIKQEVSAHVLDEKNELWIERFEERKVEVLKELQAELTKRNELMTVLRAELDIKAGSLAEAHARVQDLESRLDEAQTKAASLQREAMVLLDEARAEKSAHRKELDEVHLAAAQRDQAHRSAREEGLEREERLRVEWGKAKEKAVRLEEEHKRDAARIEALESRQAEDARTIEQLSADLRTARDELSTEIQQSADRLKAAREELEGEKAALGKRIEEIKAAAAAELAGTQSKLAQAREDYEAASARWTAELKEADATEAGLKTQLAAVNGSLEEVRKALHVAEQDKATWTREKAALQHELDNVTSVGTAADAEQLRTLRALVEQLVREKESLVAAKRTAEDSRRNLSESHGRLKSDGEAAEKLIAQLRRELAAAQAETAQAAQARADAVLQAEARAEQKLAAREQELQEAAVKERQVAAAAALQQGKELNQRELLHKGNELKRANNKFEELLKKHNRALNDLAKAKARPVIDPHMASSSTNGDPSPQQLPRALVRPNGASNGSAQRISDVAPSSDLTTLESEDSPVKALEAVSDPTALKRKREPKAVTFADPEPAAAPVKPKRRTSAASTSAATKPTQKTRSGGSGANGKARSSRAPRIIDDEDVEEDAERTLVELDEEDLELGGGGSGAAEEDGEDEDEIVDSSTPRQPVSSKPKPRTVYSSSSKKRR